VALGALLVAIGLVPAPALEHALENPARTAANGGAVIPTTVDGAALLRLLAPVAGAALAALALMGDRMLRLRGGAARTETPAAPRAGAMGAGATPGTAARDASLPPVVRADILALGGALLVAAAVRVPFLAESLWYDEIAAFLGYGVHGPGPALGNYFTQANHILQSALAALSAAVLGASEFSLRLPSLLAGLGAVPAVWWLGREARAPGAARAAAFAVALMPVAVLASTEARGYALMLLFSALATAAFLRALRTRRADAWAVYAVLAALGVWSHLVTVCVPLGHGAWCACVLVGGRGLVAAGAEVRRRDALAGLVALAVAALVTVALLAPALPEMVALRREFRALDGDEPGLWSVHGLEMLILAGGTWTWWASCAALPLMALGARAAWTEPSLRRAAVLGLLGVAVALVGTTLLGSWLYARFLLFAVPALALVAGAGTGAATETGAVQRRALGWGAAVLAATAWCACLATLPPRQPIREGVAYIAEHRAPSDRALAIGLPDDVHQIYAGAFDLEMPGSGPYGRDIARRLAERRPRWILMLYPRALPATLHELLRQEGFRPVARLPGWLDRGDGEVVVLERSAAP
jgi:hypothetical protein